MLTDQGQRTAGTCLQIVLRGARSRGDLANQPAALEKAQRAQGLDHAAHHGGILTARDEAEQAEQAIAELTFRNAATSRLIARVR